MGATKQAKGRGSRRQRRQAAPAGYSGGKVSRHRKGQAPPDAWFAPFPSAARVQARGCKGRSPLHEIALVSPFPGGEGGRGDGGDKDN